MFSNNPNATPIWILLIFAAVTYFGYPVIKRYMSKYSSDESKQKFYAFIVLLIVMAIVVTLSVIIFP